RRRRNDGVLCAVGCSFLSRETRVVSARRRTPMAEYLALTYTADVDWWAPEQAEELAEYRRFGVEYADQVKASAVLHPTSTATVVRVEGARGGADVTTDGPSAGTQAAVHCRSLTGAG